MNILYIQSSPRGAESSSIRLTDAFVEACRLSHPSLDIRRLNVWEADLPEFDQSAIGAKYKAIRGEAMTPRETEVWQRIEALIADFQRADRILLGTPMWNFSVPYKLKQLIDLVMQRNFLFTYDGKEYGPNLATQKAIAVYTRGSHYQEGTPLPPSRFEHQATYIDFLLDLIGVAERPSVVIDNAWNEDDADSARSIAKGRAALVDLVPWFVG